MFVSGLMIVAILLGQTNAPILSADDAIAPPLSAPELRVHAPMPFFSAQYTSSDDAMNAQWRAAATNIEARRRTGFSEDVFSTVGPFWGDAYMIGRAFASWAGDPAVLRAGIERVQRPSPVPDPATDGKPLAAYSLLWPQMLLAYYNWTGDKRYCRELAEFALSEWLTYFEAARDDTGLILGGKLYSGELPWVTPYAPEASSGANSIVNAIYFRALLAAVDIANAAGLDPTTYESAAQRIKAAYRAQLWEPTVGLFRDAPGIQTFSAIGNALAMGAGFATPQERAGIAGLVRRDASLLPDRLRPLAVESCFRVGEFDLGYFMLSNARGSSWDCSVLYLLPQYVAGVSAGEPGWPNVQLLPRFPSFVTSAELSIPIPSGRATLARKPGQGIEVQLPPDTMASVRATMGESVMVKNVLSHGKSEMAPGIAETLARYGWTDRVGADQGVWISVREQMLRVVQGGGVIYQARCATAENGIGSQMNSLQTPLGWHTIVKKVGNGEPWGRVFRSRVATREIWRRGEKPSEDLVLTRVFLLDGLEPGINKGGSVDSYDRNIYIHGTNDEGRIGTPSSHGCIRLTNDDVLDAFELIPEKTLVLITEE